MTEEIIQEMLKSTNNLTIHMVINFDLLSVDISTYLSRLHYTQNKMVSFPKPRNLLKFCGSMVSGCRWS